eukprot:TRINITY_DN22072_c0_g1_i1.p1 TRINITY_DN22072_c0_g1~~TRINITY_DN22072_c0_g1_i1.p1  ORF type:complete len:347 (-),score=28.33 TRINITY_DN22072_c0_g1_i1:211-1251(-)
MATHPETRSSGLRLASKLYELRGILTVAFSSILFSIMGAGVSYIGSIIPATQSMLLRSTFQALFSLSYLLWYDIPKLGDPDVRLWVIFRGTIGALANWTMFFGVTHMSIGDANAILFSAPIFTVVLGWLLSGEQFRIFESTSVLLGVVGVTLISRPPFLFGNAEGTVVPVAGDGVPRWVPVVLCMLGAVSNGSIFLVVKRIGNKAHWMALVLSFALCGIVIASSLLLLGVEEVRWPVEYGISPYVMLLGIGVVASSAQCFFNYGMQREKPTVAAITRQLDVPFSFAWQVCLFGEVPLFTSILGSLLVCCSVVAVLCRKLGSSVPEKTLQDKLLPSAPESVSIQTNK